MARTISNALLETKLAECLAIGVGDLTRRDIRLPAIAGKAIAVVGVRRSGKTTFLRQHRAERVEAGEPRDAHLLVSLEDERLVGMTAEDLGWLLEEHTRVIPSLQSGGKRTVYLDEVQLVPGWESLVRRLLDAGGTNVFISGSSAKLLGREVATSLRGRSMDVLVHPFSFREALRHANAEPTGAWRALAPNQRAALDAALRTYLAVGGFPEAQGADRRDRIPLLKGYIDVMLLRDVIERHEVTNPVALRWLQRHLLANPGGMFSISKIYADLKSQGISVAKDTLHAYLDHLADAFMLRIVSMHSASERQRLVNPRKAYPIDPGLIPVYERAGRVHNGRSLETVVLLELERRGYSADWFRAGEYDVDFFAERTGDQPMLIQVSLDTTADTTWEREMRALEVGAAAQPDARAVLITLDSTPPARALPHSVVWRAASHWLLEEDA
ncbi:MAG TPA: ATP-binding protein [Gemmatimonadaceae bacterium]|nr:ATP-binding protein [Gemmatimonadaceae bacterium]